MLPDESKPTYPQTYSAARLDSALRRTGHIVTFLNDSRHSIRTEKRPMVQALLGDLCSISGVLFTLRQLVEDTDFKSHWHATAWVLCAPSGILQQHDASLFTFFIGPPRERDLEANLVEVGGEINRRKAIFTAVLQRDPLSAVLHKILTILPDMPGNVVEVYDRILLHVPEESVQRVHFAFQWIAFSIRELCLEELAEIANHPWEEPSATSSYSLCSPYKMIEEGLGLIAVSSYATIEPHKQLVTFAHQTVKDYLLSDSVHSSPAAKFSITEFQSHVLISRMIFSYLRSSLNNYLGQGSGSESVHLPLLNYSREHWYYHYLETRREGRIPQTAPESVINLLDEMRMKQMSKETQSLAAEVERPEMVCSDSWTAPTPLYCASLWGMPEVVRLVLMRGDQPDQEGGFCGKPLQAAAYNGHIEIVTMLLGQGVSIEASSGSYGTALQVAAYRGYQDIVQLLLDAGADSSHALQPAAASGNKELVQYLIEHWADINASGGGYQSALFEAVQDEDVGVAKVLIENGADVDRREAGGQNDTVLYKAAASDHSEMVRLLLRYGADPHAVGKNQDSPLEAALRNESVEIVKMLLQTYGRRDLEEEVRTRVDALLGRQSRS